jgi:Trk K+ transport system NAD-binding subunit
MANTSNGALTLRRRVTARFRYRFDTAMAKGPSRVLGWLAAVTLAFAVLGGIMLLFTNVNAGAGRTIKDFFLSLVATVDGGGEIGLNGGFSGNWVFLIVSFIVGFGGLVIVSAFIGLLATIMTEQAERLRKGRSVVVERDHSLVLGWSPKVFDVVSELVEANRNLRKACIVVLADHDAVEMNDALRERITDRGPTRIVCRSGDPSDPVSLDIVRAEAARSIVVLSESDEGDASAVRTTLALMQRDPSLARLRLVVEVTNPDTARILHRATDGRISTVVSSEVVARITAQVCRQPGLSAVYQDFLDFDGDEIYFTPAGDIAGATFAQALLAYPTASVIGLRHADGSIALDPPADTVIRGDDTIVAVAEDDDRLDLGPIPAVPPLASTSRAVPDRAIENILIIGWNALGPLVLTELDSNVAYGSTALVLVDPTLLGAEPLAAPPTSRLNVDVSHQPGVVGSDELERVIAGSHFDHIVLLCYRGGRSAAESDALTLLTLLQLRHLLAERPAGEAVPSIATELLDSRDVHLARLEHSDDFVVSERLTSLMMSQLAENPELRLVFDDLFSPTGTQLTLEPASDYAQLGTELSYAQLIADGIAAAGIVIGWRTAAPDGAGMTARLNPAKSDLIVFGAADQVIVLRSARHRTADEGGARNDQGALFDGAEQVDARYVAATISS